MPLRPNMQLQEYAAIFLRRKWLIIFSFLFILFAASVYCVVTPEQFMSSTTILVVPQRVPEGYVRSTISIRIEERLATIRQQVMSRTRLTTVMEELGLFKEERKKLPLEEVVDSMRKRIDIQVVKANDAFTLTFVHENRQMAMLTASRLASFFIDENLKAREQQAVGTSEFLEFQLQETKKKLEEQEEKVKQYKMRFMGQLPQQIEANLSMIRGLQDRFRTNADGIRSAGDRKVFLEAQAASLERSLPAVATDQWRGEQGGTADPAQHLLAELESKKMRLADLSARFTEKYPDIQRIKREVEQLEQQIGEIRKSNTSSDKTGLKKGTSIPSMPRQNIAEVQELRRLRAQIALADQEIASMKAEREEIQKAIAGVQGKVEQSPRREQEMIALTRDYENLKKSYDELLKKRLDADVSQSLEKRQKGEQFQILDPANLPEEPFKPDRKKIFALAAMAAFIVGFGGAIGLETLNPSLRGVADFRSFFELPVLASIPVLQDREYTRKQAIRKAAIFGGIVSFTAAVSVFLLMYSEKIRTILSF